MLIESSLSPFPLSQEWARRYLISKARGIRDAAYPPTTANPVTTSEESRRARIEAAPLYLRGRFERDDVLPGVEVRKGGLGKVEVLEEVTRHVLEELKADLVLELVDMMGFLPTARQGTPLSAQR